MLLSPQGIESASFLEAKKAIEMERIKQLTVAQVRKRFQIKGLEHVLAYRSYSLNPVQTLLGLKKKLGFTCIFFGTTLNHSTQCANTAYDDSSKTLRRRMVSVKSANSF